MSPGVFDLDMMTMEPLKKEVFKNDLHMLIVLTKRSIDKQKVSKIYNSQNKTSFFIICHK